MAQARGEVDFVGGIKPPAGLIVHHPIWERAYEALRSQILSGQLAPGTRLNLRDVAEQLGISVTPARDAALRLAAEGLVEGRDSRGLRVTQLTERDVAHTLELRLLLETHAIRQGGPSMTARHVQQFTKLLAVEEAVVTAADGPDPRRYAAISQRFHHALVAAAGNRMLLDLYERLHAYVVMERAQHGFVLDRVVEDHREHLAIVAALQRKDYEAAAAALAEHLNRVQAFTLSMYHRAFPASTGIATPVALPRMRHRRSRVG